MSLCGQEKLLAPYSNMSVIVLKSGVISRLLLEEGEVGRWARGSKEQVNDQGAVYSQGPGHLGGCTVEMSLMTYSCGHDAA